MLMILNLQYKFIYRLLNLKPVMGWITQYQTKVLDFRTLTSVFLITNNIISNIQYIK